MLGATKKIHFVGIGGIGMSGIAELLKNQGFEISGSDMRASDLTRYLESIGITVHIGHDPLLSVQSDVVVKSSAVHDSNVEIAAALAAKIPVIRRAEMLGEIMRMSYGIGVAGTHGKTTTTTMVGLVLIAAGLDPTVIVGGKVKNFGSNNLLGSGKHVVVEADEFDRSFLSLTPFIAGITNVEADHLEYYGNLENIKNAFIEYANKVPFFGAVIACLDDQGVQSILPRIRKRITTYGVARQADVRALDIVSENFCISYNVEYKNYRLGKISMKTNGLHNIQNSLMAVAIGLELNIPFDQIQQGLADYKGVFRRFDYKGSFDGIELYDDYAHHPTEIKATLKGMRESISSRIIAVFQPHLYSRTQEFHESFGRSFFQADCLIVAPIFPAREEPIEGVTGKLIADSAVQSGHHNVHFAETNEEILPLIKSIAKEGDLVITMGAGNIYQYGEQLLK